MRKLIAFLILALFFAGCAHKEETLSKTPQPQERLTVCNTQLPDYFQSSGRSAIFKRFPFVTLRKDVDVKGKFDDRFYASLDLVYHAKNIEEVDFWKLRDEPKSVDYIYVLPLWMKDYRKLTNDLFANICYSYNLSEEQQQILKDWIAQGGKLWVEFGVFSTKYDLFNRNGEIAQTRIHRLLRSDLAGLRFLDTSYRTFLLRSKNLDFINYQSTCKAFEVDQKRSKLEGIRRLRVDIDNYLENYIVLDGEALVVDRSGRTLVSLKSYGNGYIISLLPFEYKDAYFDGELLRWKLLFYTLKLQ